jgi:hypothetical protein
MHRFHVQSLLAIPALRVALVGRGVLKVLARYWVYWPGSNGRSPVTFAYSFASLSMVGEA